MKKPDFTLPGDANIYIYKYIYIIYIYREREIYIQQRKLHLTTTCDPVRDTEEDDFDYMVDALA